MKDFSYTKSPSLIRQLNQIEELKKQLLLTALSPKIELRLQWRALLDHIHYSLALSGRLVSQDKILELLSPQGKKHIEATDTYVMHYKDALDYLYHNWLVTQEPVQNADLIRLYNSAFEGDVVIADSELSRTLQYIQINPENSIIQAALAQFLILDLGPFSNSNEEFSHLVFQLFLYKNAYDFRRMFVLEEYFYEDLAHYKDLINKLSKQTNLTEWLEYVTKGIVIQLNRVLKNVAIEKQNSTNYQPVLELNDRQKKILSLLDQPGLKISNKMIQKMFRVSQITASRDLSKLTSLGFLITIGAGRSTYYTKV